RDAGPAQGGRARAAAGDDRGLRRRLTRPARSPWPALRAPLGGAGPGRRSRLLIMLVAAAVCPCPPLLVPEVAAGAAAELDTARAACRDALGVLAAARPDLLVVVGPADGA